MKVSRCQVISLPQSEIDQACGLGFAGDGSAWLDNSFDLVLSSGFLAFASHSGFLKAVSDADVNVRGVMGTSAGALSGSLYSAGYSPRQVPLQQHALHTEAPGGNHSMLRAIVPPSGECSPLGAEMCFSIAIYGSLVHTRDQGGCPASSSSSLASPGGRGALQGSAHLSAAAQLRAMEGRRHLPQRGCQSPQGPAASHLRGPQNGEALLTSSAHAAC